MHIGQTRIHRDLRADSRVQMPESRGLHNYGSTLLKLSELAREYKLIELRSNSEMQIRQDSKAENRIQMPNTKASYNPRKRMEKLFQWTREYKRKVGKSDLMNPNRPD
jgi:hypothetical protein